MTYRIAGLPPETFTPLFELDEAELARRNARRVRASGPGFPCRVSLEEAREGETLILLSHVSHDVATPFRTRYAILVREQPHPAPVYVDEAPALLQVRTLGLRGFDAEGMLRDAAIARPGEADAAIRALLTDPAIASIHAHNAAQGCFLAKVERD
jgi:hypothetical protein